MGQPLSLQIRDKSLKALGNIFSKMFRLDRTSLIAQGEVLPVATRSFGAIGVFAIPQMGRFYRHVLIEKNYPHHGCAVNVYLT